MPAKRTFPSNSPKMFRPTPPPAELHQVIPHPLLTDILLYVYYKEPIFFIDIEQEAHAGYQASKPITIQFFRHAYLQQVDAHKPVLPNQRFAHLLYNRKGRSLQQPVLASLLLLAYSWMLGRNLHGIEHLALLLSSFGLGIVWWKV